MNKIKRCFYLWIEKFLARYTDKIICISEAEYKSAISHNIVKKEKLNIILNGIDIKYILNKKALTKTELGIPIDSFLIGMVGRISPQKAPDTFIKSALLIKKLIPNAYFMIIGDGELRSEIQAYAKENNLDLYITGWTENPYSYMKMLDLAMLLSRWEGFGLAIIEYMATKINFIATKADAIPTIVNDGENGLLVDIDSPEQVADACFKIYSNKEKANSLRQKAFEIVSQKYDIRRVAKQHLSMFNDLIKIDK